MINIFILLIANFFLLALYQVYRFIIRPKSLLNYYKAQGLPILFSPVFGYLKQAAQDLQTRQDILYTWKKFNDRAYKRGPRTRSSGANEYILSIWRKLYHVNTKAKAFASNLGRHPVVALKDPKLIKLFFLNQEKYYIKAPAAVEIPKMILRNATIVAEGDQWRQHRKLSGPLYSYETLKALTPEIVKIVDERLNKLRETSLHNKNFLTEVQHILLEVAGKLFLGLEFSTLQFKGQTVSAFIAELIDRASMESFKALTLIFGPDIIKKEIHPRHKALIKDIEEFRGFLFDTARGQLEKILAAKDANVGKKPLLLQVIYEQMVKMNDSSLTVVDLIDEFMLFVMGMMDTTGHAILYSSYYILRSQLGFPLCNLRKEAEKTFADLEKVNLEMINDMKYANAVVKETLRLAAPLPNLLPRVALVDHELGDLRIKAGTVLMIAAVANSYDEKYHERPESFMPERWIDEYSETRESVDKDGYVYLPFSAGQKTCPGQHIGTTLTKIVMGLFVKKYNYRFSDKNYRMIFGGKFYSEPYNPLVYDLECREDFHFDRNSELNISYKR